MRIKFLWLGKTKNAAFRTLEDVYLARLQHFGAAQRVEWSLRVKKSGAIQAQIARRLKDQMRKNAHLVVLDVKGKETDSEEFAHLLERLFEQGKSELVFVVGGADGMSSEVANLADLKLSMGRWTYQHELARLVLLEQVYRALTILKSHPYHR